jgi:hypothetical protein
MGILAGCSGVNQTITSRSPVLLVQYPFPAIPVSMSKPDYTLIGDILISEDGSVSDVRLNSGNKEWDSMAASTIRQWKYSPRLVNNKPTACWVHQKMKIKIADPLMFPLAAVVCTTSEQADSVYVHLISGYKLKEAAQEFSALPVQGDNYELGEINILQYPENIRSNLSKLNEGEFTKPLQYDDMYIIFQRIKKI